MARRKLQLGRTAAARCEVGPPDTPGSVPGKAASVHGDHTASHTPDGVPLHHARHRPEQTALYRLVQQHAADFVAQAEASTGARLPRFVEDEFDAFLRSGILAHGFLRLRCGECGHDTRLAFSCKRRGFRPSCSARRMSQTVAHLVDHVVPRVPRFADAVLGLTGGRGADVVYDGLGAAAVDENLRAVSATGLRVSYGQATGPLPPIDPARLEARSVTLARPALFHYAADPRRLAEMSARLFDAIERRDLVVRIGARWPLAAAADAHRALEPRGTTGSLLRQP